MTCSVQYSTVIQYSIQFSSYSTVQCTVYSVRIQFSIYSTVIQFSIYWTVHCILNCILHCILHTVVLISSRPLWSTDTLTDGHDVAIVGTDSHTSSCSVTVYSSVYSAVYTVQYTVQLYSSVYSPVYSSVYSAVHWVRARRCWCDGLDCITVHCILDWTVYWTVYWHHHASHYSSEWMSWLMLGQNQLWWLCWSCMQYYSSVIQYSYTVQLYSTVTVIQSSSSILYCILDCMYDATVHWTWAWVQ